MKNKTNRYIAGLLWLYFGQFRVKNLSNLHLNNRCKAPGIDRLWRRQGKVAAVMRNTFRYSWGFDHLFLIFPSVFWERPPTLPPTEPKQSACVYTVTLNWNSNKCLTPHLTPVYMPILKWKCNFVRKLLFQIFLHFSPLSLQVPSSLSRSCFTHKRPVSQG